MAKKVKVPELKINARFARRYPPEELDQEPVAMPAGYGRPKTLQEMLGTMIRAAVADQAAGEELESWDEANDFEPDIEEDFLLDMSPYTLNELQEEQLASAEPSPEAADKAIAEDLSQTGDEPNPDAQEPAEGLEPQKHLPET